MKKAVSLAEYVRLKIACQLLPNRPHVATLYRWSRGIRGVRLNTVMIGGQRFTSLADIEEFVRATTAARDALGSSGDATDSRTNSVSCRLPRSRRQLIDHADRELDRRNV